MTQMSTEEAVEERVVTDPVEPGDHDLFAHYVEAEKLPDALIFGTPLRAMCGKMWVPCRDPQNFPLCPDCKDAYDNLPED